MKPHADASPADQRRYSFRQFGTLITVTSPITGFASYAAASVLVGESRMETTTGLTRLGWVAIVLPALVGLAMIAWSYWGSVMPSRRQMALSLTGAAVIAAIAGFWAVLIGRPGDSSIGGGVLVLAALGAAVGAAAMFRATDPSST